MSIREWFEVKVEYDPATVFNKSLDGLLKLYVTAVTCYLDCSPYTASVNDLISIARDRKMDIGRELFLDWFLTKGLLSMQKLSRITSVSDSDIAAEIDYETYILNEELEEPIYLDDLRASLINIANDVLALIKNADGCILDEDYASTKKSSFPDYVLTSKASMITEVYVQTKGYISKDYVPISPIVSATYTSYVIAADTSFIKKPAELQVSSIFK